MTVQVEKLIATLEGDATQFDATLRQANRKLDKFEEVGGRSTRRVGRSFTRLAGAVGIVTTALAALSGLRGLKFAENVERQNLRIEALLKSTGNTAGFTGKQLDVLARRVAKDTLASTAGIRDVIGILLTFRSIQGPVFTRAVSLSQDLAEVMGTDARQAALQLAKALEQPEIGLSALRRSGVSFSESEKDQVKALLEANKALEAQTLILDKIAQQVGGAGAGAAGGISGKLDTLSQRWDELGETIVKVTGIGTAWNWIVEQATKAVTGIDLALVRSTQSTEKYEARLKEVFGTTAEAMDATSLSAQRLVGTIGKTAPTEAYLKKQKKRQESVDRVLSRLRDERRSLTLTTREQAAYDLSQAGATRSEIARGVALADLIDKLEKKRDLQAEEARGVRGETFALGGVSGTRSTPVGGRSVQRVEDVGTKQVIDILRQIDGKLGSSGVVAVAS